MTTWSQFDKREYKTEIADDTYSACTSPLHRRASDGKTLHACLRSTGAASQQSPHDHQHDPKSLGQRKCVAFEGSGPISKWLMRLSISLLYSLSQLVFGTDRDTFSGKASQFCV